MTAVEKRTSLAIEILTVSDLLSAYSSVTDELRRREITRSSNNPLGDYAEILFCKAFGWLRESNSTSGFDATDSTKIRYQIKGRRITQHNSSRQLSAIRNLDAIPFDYLGGLLVDNNFQIIRAALIPIAIVRERAIHVKHTNSWKFLLLDNVWNLSGVRDVTIELSALAATL